MEHDTLEAAFFVAVGASAVCVVMLIPWVRGRRQGHSAPWTGVALLISVGIAALSTGWLAYERHEKCDRTVARTLCGSPIDWLRSR
jgi:drug/metabolite transporter (DMT)-like permease